MSTPILHPRSKAALERFISQPSHALLLVGPDGAGKNFTARWLCRELLGTSEREPTPDQLLWLQPDNKQIRIEQIRGAQHFAKLKLSGDKPQRIIVFEQADTMADPSQNALLKLLEEPAPGVILILLINHETAMKPTILSRCQQIKLLPLQPQDVSKLAPQLAPTEVDRYIRLSQGYPGRFLALTENKTSDDLEQAKAYLGQSLFDRIASHESLNKDRDAATQLVTNILTLCRAAMSQAIEQGKTTPGQAWLNRSEACFTTIEQLTKNANIKLALDLLALNLV